MKVYIDAENEVIFDELYEERKKEWPIEFNNWFEIKNGRSRSIPDTIKKCMLMPVRRLANLGNPPGKFTNNTTESLNLVIKEAQNHESRDICSFLETIKEKMFEQQKGEMIKAVYRTGEYRLADEIHHLCVEPSTWQQMNVDQRKALLKKIFSTDVESVTNNGFEARKPLAVPIDDPSLSLCLPTTMLQQLLNKAEFLHKNCMVTSLLGGNVWVTDYDSCHTVYYDKNKLHSDGRMYAKTARICSHVMVAAEKNGQLSKFMRQYSEQKNKCSQIISANEPKRAGDKVHEKKKRKGANNVQKQPITCRIKLQADCEPSKKRAAIYDKEIDEKKECDFKDFWHNDELFYIVHVNDDKEC